MLDSSSSPGRVRPAAGGRARFSATDDDFRQPGGGTTTIVVDCAPSDGWPYAYSLCGRNSCDPPECSTRFYGDADGVHLVYEGNRLWSQRPHVSVVSPPATARKGHTVLERELVGQRVGVESRVTITYLRAREACRETRTHCAYRLEVVA